MSGRSKPIASTMMSDQPKSVIGLNIGAAFAIVGLALVPKCPMCFVAWAGVLGSLGLTLAVVTDALQGLFSVCLVAALFSTSIQARRSGNYAPLLLCSVCVVVVLIGKFALDSPVLVAIGLVALVGYSFARLRKPSVHGFPRPASHA